MNSAEHHAHFNLDKLLHNKMSKIYIYQAMISFAKSMIGIFVPVFLYKLNFSIVDIILYTLGNSITYLIMIPLSISIIQKIGFKKTILLTTPIYILHLISLNYIQYSNIFFHLSWLSFGIYTSLFWPAMHSEITSNSNKKTRGSQLGTIQIITTLISTIAPLIGGFFLETLSYWYLILFASTIIFLGTIPLLMAKDIKIKIQTFNFKDYIRLIKTNKYHNSKIAFSAEGVEWLLNITIWPIIVFILLSQNFLKLGILFTVVSLITIIFVIYFKTLIDKEKKEKYLKKITKLLSVNWLLKSITILFSSIFLYFVESTSKLLLNLFNLNYMSIFYNNAQKIGYMDYIILRELYLHSTKIFVSLFIFIPFLLIFKENLITLSALAFFGVIFSLGLSFLKEE